jgi:hypothetical protein
MSAKTHKGGSHHELAAEHHETAAHHHREARAARGGRGIAVGTQAHQSARFCVSAAVVSGPERPPAAAPSSALLRDPTRHTPVTPDGFAFRQPLPPRQP